MDIGKKLKRLRQEKNLTMDELASRSELSKGFISQLEHNTTSPSLYTLDCLLECLGTNLRDFFNDFVDERIVFTKEDFYALEDSDLGYKIDWVVPNAQKNTMEPIILTLASGGRYKEETSHQGEEFGYVLQGSVILHYGSKKLKVKCGEVFSFKSNANHYISNIGKKEAKVLWVSSPPSF